MWLITMRKKYNPPRKRKRVIKKVLFLSLLLVVFVIIIGGGAYYLSTVMLKKQPYISPLPKMQTVSADSHDTQDSLLQNGLKQKQIAYTAISKEKDGSYKVVLEKGSEVTFSSQKDIMTQIASLQYILSHLTMEGRQFQRLDLRFDKPVIVMK